MSDSIEVVKKFLASKHTWDDWMATVASSCTIDCVWSNTGSPTITGLEQMLAAARAARQHSAVETMDIEVLHIAATGNIVLTERIDRLRAANGSLIADLPIMGAFEVTDGKIGRWSDYFDPGAVSDAASRAGDAHAIDGGMT